MGRLEDGPGGVWGRSRLMHQQPGLSAASVSQLRQSAVCLKAASGVCAQLSVLLSVGQLCPEVVRPSVSLSAVAQDGCGTGQL